MFRDLVLVQLDPRSFQIRPEMLEWRWGHVPWRPGELLLFLLLSSCSWGHQDFRIWPRDLNRSPLDTMYFKMDSKMSKIPAEAIQRWYLKPCPLFRAFVEEPGDFWPSQTLQGPRISALGPKKLPNPSRNAPMALRTWAVPDAPGNGFSDLEIV